MIKQSQVTLSPYTELYNLIVPKDNMLRQINEMVDFSFVYEELATNYCLDNGRGAIDPVRMFKCLLLKSIFELSDVDVVERSKYDMSFKYFLEINPEAPVIDPSSLTKFRKLRLKNSNLLDLLINKSVEIALNNFEYNKGAEMYVCKEGHMAFKKARQGKKNVGANQAMTYYFDVEKCKRCSHKEGCYKEGALAIFAVNIKRILTLSK